MGKPNEFIIKTNFLDGIDHIDWLLDVGDKFLKKEYKYNTTNQQILYQNITNFLNVYYYKYTSYYHHSSTQYQLVSHQLLTIFVNGNGEITPTKIKKMMEYLNFLRSYYQLRYDEEEFLNYYKKYLQFTRVEDGIDEIYVKRMHISQLEYGLSQKWDYEIIEKSILHKYQQNAIVNRFVTNEYFIYPYRFFDKELTVKCQITQLNAIEHTVYINIQIPPRHIVVYNEDIKAQITELIKEQLQFTPILFLSEINMIPISEVNTNIGIPITSVKYIYNIDAEKENLKDYKPLTIQIMDENNQHYEIFL